jgi:hypothetical protein
VRLNQLYADYRDQVQFYMVYIREAHPSDGWQVPNNLIEDIIFPEPTTDGARAEVASACQIALDIHMPMLVDSIDNSVDEKYVGLPMRLFLVDAGGKIAYAGDKGPWGWDDEGFEDAIKGLVG